MIIIPPPLPRALQIVYIMMKIMIIIPPPPLPRALQIVYIMMKIMIIIPPPLPRALQIVYIMMKIMIIIPPPLPRALQIVYIMMKIMIIIPPPLTSRFANSLYNDEDYDNYPPLTSSPSPHAPTFRTSKEICKSVIICRATDAHITSYFHRCSRLFGHFVVWKEDIQSNSLLISSAAAT